MGSQLLIAAMAAGIGFSPLPAQNARLTFVSGDCSAAAERVVAQTGGQLLSAQPSGNTCVITVLVPGNGGRPRKVTVHVPV